MVHEANVDMALMVPKTSVGIVGSIMAMSINDIAGLIVAVLTAVYMALQIEAALRKRKIATDRGKEWQKEQKEQKKKQDK